MSSTRIVRVDRDDPAPPPPIKTILLELDGETAEALVVALGQMHEASETGAFYSLLIRNGVPAAHEQANRFRVERNSYGTANPIKVIRKTSQPRY